MSSLYSRSSRFFSAYPMLTLWLAGLLALAAVLLRLALEPLLGANVPFILLFPVVLGAAALGGSGAGTVALVVGGAASWILLLHPPGHAETPGFDELLAGTLLLAGGAFMIWIAAELRVAIEEAVRSRARLDAALLASGTGTWRWDVRADVIESDESLLSLYGFAPSAPPRRSADFLAVIHPADRPGVETRLSAALAACSELEHQFRIVDPVHGVRWIYDRSRVLRSDDGVVFAMVGASRDITDQKRMEDRLRRRTAELETVLTAVPAGVWFSYGPAVVEVRRNPFAATLMRMEATSMGSLDEVARNRITHLAVHKDGALVPSHRLPLQRALAGDEFSDEAYEYRFDDGTSRFVLMSARRLVDPIGETLGAVSVGVDVTDRLAAERALRESEARFRSLANLVPAIVWFADAEGRTDFINDRWFEYTGHDPSAPVAWELALHPDDRDRTLAAWRRTVRSGESYEIEMRYRRYDGEYRWYVARAEPVRDAEGRVSRWFGTSADIHDRKVAEECLRDLNVNLEMRVGQEVAAREAAQVALAQAQKMEAIGQLTGGVAHDFNNLLQALSGCLQMIQRRVPDPAIRSFVEAGQQAVERGGKLTQQLMAFARRQALRPEATDVRNHVLGMSELLTRALRADIDLSVDLAPDIWPIEVDPTQFEVGLLNLAVNARDAMEAGGTLTIACRNVSLRGQPGTEPMSGDFVEIAVTDTGTGMEPAVLARVYEPFFTTKPVGKGSGLGLSQVYGFARQSGGTVRIVSAPGEGTTVTMVLPRARELPRAKPEAPVGRTAGASGRILVVEDDAIVGAMVATTLRDVGFDVARANTADDALVMMERGEPVDLVFSDIVMPGLLSGIDLARRLKRERPELPVVLTTGYSENVEVPDGVRVLPKPYQIPLLLDAIEEELRRRPALRAAVGA